MRAGLPHFGGLYQSGCGCHYIGRGLALPWIEGVYIDLKDFLLLVIRSRVELQLVLA